MLNIWYQIHISVLTPLNFVDKEVTKKKEPLNLMLAEPSEVKSIAFPFSLC